MEHIKNISGMIVSEALRQNDKPRTIEEMIANLRNVPNSKAKILTLQSISRIHEDIQAKRPLKVIEPSKMRFQGSIAQMKKVYHEASRILDVRIMMLMIEIFRSNPKATSINENSIKAIRTVLTTDYSHLELQEIEYVLFYGINGRLGKIYKEVTIDSIVGEDGWFDVYDNEIRPKRQEQIMAIYEKALHGSIGYDQVKAFYKLKGLDLPTMQDHGEIYASDFSKMPDVLIVLESNLTTLMNDYEIDMYGCEDPELLKESENEIEKLKIRISSIKKSLEKGLDKFVMSRHSDFIINNYNKI